MADQDPRVTVVTICKNAVDGIERTLRSVAGQDYPALEHVVVDGASSDGTRSIIDRYRGHVHRFLGEPDRGISHAFNNGIAASTGQWILMLNAGDAFIGNDALRRLVAGIDGSTRIVSARSRCGNGSIPRIRIHDGLALILRAHLSHQATLVHRDVYAAYGGYDESYRIRMDFDFFLRVLPRERLTFVDRWLVDFQPGGISGRRFLLHWSEGRRAVAHNRCGAAARLQYESLFLLLGCERVLRTAAAALRA